MSDDLSRMGAARVVVFIDEAGRQVIEKCPVGDVEYHFYHHAARELAGLVRRNGHYSVSDYVSACIAFTLHLREAALC
ncbi:hypothetical protein ACTV2B_001593 [Cronobacter turicensis]|nr:hypothetical protein [Cronobacter turicensis]ELY2742831.1 hypothetical protein [Cronobacter turicensis]ELY2783886.1 hypothetical protein [Cronobacter turicensis]